MDAPEYKLHFDGVTADEQNMMDIWIKHKLKGKTLGCSNFQTLDDGMKAEQSQIPYKNNNTKPLCQLAFTLTKNVKKKFKKNWTTVIFRL